MTDFLGSCPIVEWAQEQWQRGVKGRLAKEYDNHLRLAYAREARLTGGQLVDMGKDDFIEEKDLSKVDPYNLNVMYLDGTWAKQLPPELPECDVCGSLEISTLGVCRDCRKRSIAEEIAKAKAERIAKYGDATYFEAEEPCKKCGSRERYVLSNQCGPCGREASRRATAQEKARLERERRFGAV